MTVCFGQRNRLEVVVFLRLVGHERAVAAPRVAQLGTHVVQQQVAVDALRLADLLRMAGGAADRGEQLLAALQEFGVLLVLGADLRGSGQFADERHQRGGLLSRHIVPLGHVLGIANRAGLGMLRHVQAQFDGAGGQREVLQAGDFQPKRPDLPSLSFATRPVTSG
jgi:hypothetical protein